jgi:hypothetical protein
MRQEMVEDPIEIVPNFRRKLDARHCYRASVLGFGLAVLSPDSRRSR